MNGKNINCSHERILVRFAAVTRALETADKALGELCSLANAHSRKRAETFLRKLSLVDVSGARAEAELLQLDYGMATADVLGCVLSDREVVSNYYYIIDRERFPLRMNSLSLRVETVVKELFNILRGGIAAKSSTRSLASRLEETLQSLSQSRAIVFDSPAEKQCSNTCKCGGRMTTISELSELHCSLCGRVKKIIGAVFRDDQFYPQDGQKAKHGGYDTSRHQRFWMERLQAQEAKTFEQCELAKISAAIKRNRIDSRELTCDVMRMLLKDPLVSLTSLNDHVPLLIKTFGGRPPPILDYGEKKLCAIRFNKAMEIYETLLPDDGNKPYYPSFMHQILKEMFRDNPEKLRIVNYIHLQSRDTVIHNDKTFERICLAADPSDGLRYSPTDPVRYNLK